MEGDCPEGVGRQVGVSGEGEGRLFHSWCVAE